MRTTISSRTQNKARRKREILPEEELYESDMA